MSAHPSHGRLARALATALVMTGTAASSACGENPRQPETGSDAPDIRGAEDLEDPYDGPYTPDFHDDVEAYVDQEVTLEASVDRTVSSVAFTITGRDGEDVEPLLVVADDPLPELQAGQDVVVAAVPHDEFDLSVVEDDLDASLPGEPYEEWEGEPYLSASTVTTDPAAE
ncbi:hypothetical protein [Geodermatophilus sp. SYSU D00696]